MGWVVRKGLAGHRNLNWAWEGGFGMSVDGEQKDGSSNDPKTLAKRKSSPSLWAQTLVQLTLVFTPQSSLPRQATTPSQPQLPGLANSPSAQNLRDLLHAMWPSNSIPRLQRCRSANQRDSPPVLASRSAYKSTAWDYLMPENRNPSQMVKALIAVSVVKTQQCEPSQNEPS